MHLSNTLPHNNRIEIGCEGQEKAKKAGKRGCSRLQGAPAFAFGRSGAPA